LSARSKGRKRAVDALYAGELRDVMATDLLDATKEQVTDRQNQDEIFDFATELVNGVLANQLEIDEILSGVAQNWTLDRMPALDKAILRVGIYEIAFGGTPAEVAISGTQYRGFCSVRKRYFGYCFSNSQANLVKVNKPALEF
jgi:N utilization substance protein B